jgi:predicted dehydrogenase
VSFSKVLFIGLGGAGQRHLRIFRQLLPRSTVFTAYRRTGATLLLRTDFSVDVDNTVESAYDIKVFDSLDSAFADSPDLAVISTPTSCHREPMMMALSANCGVFVEKPWAENLNSFPAFRSGVLQKGLPFHVSFQRRFHPQIAQAHQAFSSGAVGRPLTASFTVFSHVPSWHAYEDWRNLYAVRQDLGGGVLLTEIHEIDLANWFFGLPEAVFCTGGNRSAARLKVEDTVQLTLIYPDFSALITLCFMHEKTSRAFHIAGTAGDIKWDGNSNHLSVIRFGGAIEDIDSQVTTNDTMFIAQAEKFVYNWSSDNTLDSLASAANSLAVVDAAQRSMCSGRVERIHFVP